MPPLSVSNQGRRENFFNMLTGGMFKNPIPVSTDLSNWSHLTPVKTTEANKGFVTQLQDPRLQWLYGKIKVEVDRLSTLLDIRHMLENSSFVAGPCDKFINIVVDGDFALKFNGGTAKTAERIVNDMLDRIEYRKWRGDYLFNGLFLELFLNKKISFQSGVETLQPEQIYKEFVRGASIGRIESILGPLAPETMFRNSNKQDLFDNPDKAFYQVPEIYNNPNTPIEYNQFKEWFNSFYVLHPRWNYKRQKSQRYSRSSLASARMVYNRSEMAQFDACIQRHVAATNILVFYLNRHGAQDAIGGLNQDEVDKAMQKYLQEFPRGVSPGTSYFTSGENEVASVGGMNLTITKPSDIYMHFEFLSMSFLLPPMLIGFSGGEGGRVSGPLLAQLKDILGSDIRSVNRWEDVEIIKPLCYLELFMHGIFDTEIQIVHAKPSFLTALEKQSAMAEVAANLMSKEIYHRMYIEPVSSTKWVDDSKVIEEELKKFGPATPTENAQKGISGSKKEITKPEVK